MQGTVLLPDQDNHIAPWGLARMNCSCFQHIPERGVQLLQEGQGYTPEPFFKRLIILDVDFVLYSASATQFIALQREHIMISPGSSLAATAIHTAIQLHLVKFVKELTMTKTRIPFARGIQKKLLHRCSRQKVTQADDTGHQCCNYLQGRICSRLEIFIWI